MLARRLTFRVHAIERMAERRINVDDVLHVIETGETIEAYPADYPYPSRLVLGWIDLRPIHVVAADVDDSDQTIVITVYEPDAGAWDRTFRRRLS